MGQDDKKVEEIAADDPQAVFAAKQLKWNKLVGDAADAYFSKMIVIVGGKDMQQAYTWSPIAYTEADCVAQQWQKDDEMINENQELSKDWTTLEVESPFYFF